MKILLDTHIFLWFISGDTQLLTDVRDAIRNPDNEVYLSAVSVWEAIVKTLQQLRHVRAFLFLCRRLTHTRYLSPY
ncbi:type II toxin-antitoxin system VapC family toxin [Calothrix sp. UHCC 0171]|uniref:type II toxin-antitoxin system VapC family toxin n=1 Tax=Calothrix sp. UHCC 0171 TaxID=3110245 RepID=UPI002B1EDEDA|nr:PIN domain-containing protein [Calothrix sp. UHCC 0171]MEA5570499.1 PIN domain-containing protein [Calothrix sp. UHCC 0171]